MIRSVFISTVVFVSFSTAYSFAHAKSHAKKETPVAVETQLQTVPQAPVQPVLTMEDEASQPIELSQNEIAEMAASQGKGDSAKTNQAVADVSATTEQKQKADSESSTLSSDSVESETPVFKKAEKVNQAEPESTSVKLLMTLGILTAVFGVAFVALKKFSKREQQSADPLRIKVLGQHFLSPKRSLLVVQIAGETLLLGATDQNINLLKNLALLDEDLPTQTPSQFDTTLKDHSMNEDLEENFALQGLTEVRDRVTKKLSEMRNL